MTARFGAAGEPRTPGSSRRGADGTKVETTVHHSRRRRLLDDADRRARRCPAIQGIVGVLHVSHHAVRTEAHQTGLDQFVG